MYHIDVSLSLICVISLVIIIAGYFCIGQSRLQFVSSLQSSVYQEMFSEHCDISLDNILQFVHRNLL